MIYPINLLLADDDEDDCLLFKEALEELPLSTNLKTVNDGEQLMQLLAITVELPAIIFLDLNMPKKNGFECLSEIMLSKKLNKIPLIIYSTSFDPVMVNRLHNNGANHYIRKPAEFSKLKDVIYKSILLITQAIKPASGKEKFIIHG